MFSRWLPVYVYALWELREACERKTTQARQGWKYQITHFDFAQKLLLFRQNIEKRKQNSSEGMPIRYD